MTQFEAKQFNIPELVGISKQTIEEHMKLYVGYVTHSNAVLEKIAELSIDAEKNMPILSGLQRRFGFEYNGMRNHEVYFSLLEGDSSGSVKDTAPTLGNAIADQWGTFEAWVDNFQAIASTRGIGWAMLYYDRKEKKLLNAWVDEQHLGQLQDCTLIFALDMWEHSFVSDYQPSGKKQYVLDFFKNVNWSVAEKRFDEK